MHKISVLTTILITIASFAQKIPKKINESDFSIGKTVQIKSAILKEDRTLNIYFPASYNTNNSKKYPVIYLLDGSKNEDFIHIAGIVQFGSFPWINMLPEAIVVGIGNVDRKRDFTYPSTLEIDQKEFPTSGKSKQFIQFLQKELLPFINANYRVTNNKTLIGQSLGGLLATEVLFKTPNLFNNYIIVSPSLWWDAEKLLTFTPVKYTTKKNIYIAVGKEGPIMERTAKELYNKLLDKATENSKLHFDFLEDKTHGDALHEAVYNAFEKIFKSDI
ncbi:alpha/beta hydrolase [Tenacibaculum sp. Mcav3-52]|uniref:Alpha/beta hydrolase-fold protein n=1 Tax=Tenacibaculum sp. Pbs-1 TaxID=3238748 RepID=A0AB33L1J8_9FLAO|nr:MULTISPECIES: alpha/beta hydrolase-fold protein [unclassified Tenacibaculum]BFF40508.1 alpha/beta hydrolase-fold protein [Tenacibaculum mesophilum]GFD75956.1 esterase [Tenacibaculum sp. KUL113]GFD83182.1 esterase [Tenacibaculum sp. KUL118]MCG7501509.1 alpha/beta hydrolase [Tenacibaculum sp. Mcav3-52]MCO7184791.1 alpha/beta hydrolase-fold protein [Tenacibaculum sp. XPcli2-G]